MCSTVGSWCYTLDPDVPMDICDVRDCQLPEECIIITDGNWEGLNRYRLRFTFCRLFRFKVEKYTFCLSGKKKDPLEVYISP